MVPQFSILCRDDDDQADVVLAAAARAGIEAGRLDAAMWRQPGKDSTWHEWQPGVVSTPSPVVWARAMPSWPAKLMPPDATASADVWHGRIADHAEVERWAWGMVVGWEAAGTVVYPSPQQRWRQQKMAQLSRWHDAGVVIPKSLVTHSVHRLRGFAAAAPGRVVVKPLSGAGHAAFLPAVVHERALEACPVLLQHHIPGDDVRVMVIDGAVVAATMTAVADDIADGRLSDARPTPWWPSAHEQRCAVVAAQSVGHQITALDARRTPDGQLVWLESNPTPTVIDMQAATDVDIATAIAWALQRMGIRWTADD